MLSNVELDAKGVMKRQRLEGYGWRCIAGADPHFRTPPKLALVLSPCRSPTFIASDLVHFLIVVSCTSHTDITYILKVRE